MSQLPEIAPESPIYKRAKSEHREKQLIARALTLNTLRRLGDNGQLNKTNLSSTLLKKTSFESSCLVNADFTDTFIDGEVNFKKAYLLNVDFTKAKMTSKAQIDFEEAHLEGVDFSKTKELEGAIKDGRVKLRGASYDGS